MVNAMVTFVSFAFVSFVMRLIVINHPPNIKSSLAGRALCLSAFHKERYFFWEREASPVLQVSISISQTELETEVD